MKRKKHEPIIISPLVLEDSAAGAEYRREVLRDLQPAFHRAIRLFKPSCIDIYIGFMNWFAFSFILYIHMFISRTADLAGCTLLVSAAICFAAFHLSGIKVIGQLKDEVRSFLVESDYIECYPRIVFEL